jgi:putative endonuclease
MGEIDIIARHGDDLVFIEVRTRSTSKFGTGAESVNWRKQKQVRTLAAIYLSARNIGGLRIRFDMISIQLRAGEEPKLEHLRNAF